MFSSAFLLCIATAALAIQNQLDGDGVREIKDWMQIFKITKCQTLLWKIESLFMVKDLTDLVQLVLKE